jgi:cell division protein FtsL
LAVFLVVLGALGVITLNNLVIERSAELGRLDDSRREFRTKNALLSAKIAKLGAPPRIVRIAKKRFGMQPTAHVASFIYLEPPAVVPKPVTKPGDLPIAEPGSKEAAGSEAFGQVPLQTNIPNPFVSN